MKWANPGGTLYSPLYYNMAKQPHLLIAGATGSGKSVVINGIIQSLLACQLPSTAQFILIDPKRVELVMYRDLPHTVCYASEISEMIQALRYTLFIIDDRYKAMQKQGEKKYTGSDLYVIIDELADLMTTCKKDVQPLLQRICQIGRAAKVHVIAATQCPLATVIPTAIKVNFDARVGLRTRSAQDSRNILGQSGCETLPRYGQGYYMTPERMKPEVENLHYFKDSDLQALVDYWTSPACKIA